MSVRNSPIVIGIAGGSGSGKTTVAQEVLARVGAEKIAFLSHDAYYRDFGDLSFSQRSAINFDHPDSLETPLLIEHIIKLKAHNPGTYQFTISNHIRARQKRFWLNHSP